MLLIPPTFVAAWGATGSLALACVATGAMLFSGLMFGPDLDIQSRPYARWGLFRFIWWPYRVMFRHRSRWSHGIIFGTLIRIVYFAAVISLLVWGGILLRAWVGASGALPGWQEIAQAWHAIEHHAAAYGVGRSAILAALAGLWWGAASHTLTDVFWSVIRKGSEIF